jgi:hypothetical protein
VPPVRPMVTAATGAPTLSANNVIDRGCMR